MVNERMTVASFELATKNMRLNEQSRAIAYESLVNGRSPQDVADEFGVTRQWVHDRKKRVWANYLKLQDLPDDWVVIQVRLPRDKARQLRKLEERLLAQAAKNRSSA